MLHADADQAAINQQALEEFRQPHTAIVQTIDLEETTFSQTFRIDLLLKLDSSDHELAAKLVEKTPDEEKVSFADSFVRSSLRAIANKIDDSSLRNHYMNDDLDTRDMLEVLNYASSTDLKNFTMSLYNLSLVDDDVHTFVMDKLDNVLHYYSLREKYELVDFLLEDGNQQAAQPFVSAVCRSSENLEELVHLIEGIGVDRLLETGNTEVKEFVAHAVLGPMIRAVRFPEKLESDASPDLTQRTLDEIKEGLEEILDLAKSDARLIVTQVSKDYVHTAETDLATLQAQRNEEIVTAPVVPEAPTPPVAPESPTTPQFDPESSHDIDPTTQSAYEKALAEYETALEEYQQKLEDYRRDFEDYQREWKAYELAVIQYREDLAESRENLREIANVHLAVVDLEYHYGVNIGYGKQEWLGMSLQDILRYEMTEPTRWTEKDIEDVRTVLEGIPEGHVLFSPLLREIQKVPYLGWGVLGARFNHGVIKIADLTFDNESISTQYEGKSSLGIVLAHEVGHGIQIGDEPSWIVVGDDGKPQMQIGEARYDFDEWMELSGWETIENSRWEAGAWGDIILDGKEYSTGVPIEHNGEKIVLVRLGWNNLVKFDAEANFSSRWYAKASPWEDFAEAFSEYVFLPERLIKDAPEKFQHLEQEFRKYDDNVGIQKTLEEALEKQKMEESSSNSETTSDTGEQAAPAEEAA